MVPNSAMSAQCPVCAKADMGGRFMTARALILDRPSTLLTGCGDRPGLRSREFRCNLLMRHMRFSPQSGEKPREFNALLRTHAPQQTLSARCSDLFEYLVGAADKRQWDGQPRRPVFLRRAGLNPARKRTNRAVAQGCR